MTNHTSQAERVNVVCVKWGKRYGSHYVNRLFAGVTRSLARPFRFLCVTENPAGLVEGIEVVPFPPDPGLKRQWPDVLVKQLLFQDGFADLQGPTLFLDLDVVITGSIDCFFEYEPGKNCIIHNWTFGLKPLFGIRPAIGNSSIFRFEAGKSGYIYETFIREMHRAEDLSIYRTSQAFQTYAMKEVKWWPEEWARSFKRHCRPTFPLNLFRTPQWPKDCRILVFHGLPDPDEAIRGFRGRRIHHHTRPAQWVSEFWQTAEG